VNRPNPQPAPGMPSPGGPGPNRWFNNFPANIEADRPLTAAEVAELLIRIKRYQDALEGFRINHPYAGMTLEGAAEEENILRMLLCQEIAVLTKNLPPIPDNPFASTD
jgi:hypothetical protein